MLLSSFPFTFRIRTRALQYHELQRHTDTDTQSRRLHNCDCPSFRIERIWQPPVTGSQARLLGDVAGGIKRDLVARQWFSQELFPTSVSYASLQYMEPILLVVSLHFYLGPHIISNCKALWGSTVGESERPIGVRWGGNCQSGTSSRVTDWRANGEQRTNGGDNFSESVWGFTA